MLIVNSHSRGRRSIAVVDIVLKGDEVVFQRVKSADDSTAVDHDSGYNQDHKNRDNEHKSNAEEVVIAVMAGQTG